MYFSRRGEKLSAKWPCGVCQRDCKDGCVIECESCQKWHHIECEHLPKTNFDQLSKINDPYICVACRSKEGLFDYDASLLRLASSTKIPDLKRKRVHKINDSVSATERDIALKEKASKSLINCAQREALIIPDIAKSHNPTTVDTLPIDYAARSIMEKCDISGYIPGLASGDGNCLFNAVSTGILGNESLSTELRVRCTIEMAINGLKYTDNMGDLILVSRDYVDSLFQFIICSFL